MKKLVTVCASLILAAACTLPAHAADIRHTVVSGDTMWKLAVRYQVGISEIIGANPQVENPDLIYPGQILKIPQLDSRVTNYETEVVKLVNEQRAKYNLAPLAMNWELARVARYKSQDMADKGYFSHTSPTYGSPYTMMKAFGITYRTAGENIAYGYSSPKAVVEAWMNSEGHRANILNTTYTQIGVGYVYDGNFWTQMFIS